MTKKEILIKHIPNGSVNLKLVGGGNGKAQYEHEQKIMIQMLEEYGKYCAEQLFEKIFEWTNVDIDDKCFKEWWNEFVKEETKNG